MAVSLTPDLQSVLDQEIQDLLDKGAVDFVKHPVPTEGFISSWFVVPKKGSGESSGSQSETTESISGIRTLQNGGCLYVTRPFKTGGLACKN